MQRFLVFEGFDTFAQDAKTVLDRPADGVIDSETGPNLRKVNWRIKRPRPDAAQRCSETRSPSNNHAEEKTIHLGHRLDEFAGQQFEDRSID